MSRSCSQCGKNGHNSRTCTESGGDGGGAAASVAADSGSSGGGFMLFGVRVTEDPIRKCVSLNNLSQYEQQPREPNPDLASTGYASEDVVHHSSNRGRERKRGIPWTEEEHRLFLLGLQKVGKGDWRGISRNFVKTRTPTQVASHAQKYFLRKSNQNRRRRRSSLFDITTTSDSFKGSSIEEGKVVHTDQSQSGISNLGFLPAAASASASSNPLILAENSTTPTDCSVLDQLKKIVRPEPVIPSLSSSKPLRTVEEELDLNVKSKIDPSHLSLKLSTPWSISGHSAFEAMTRLNREELESKA